MEVKFWPNKWAWGTGVFVPRVSTYKTECPANQNDIYVYEIIIEQSNKK
jgi:hypothetical protein